MLVLASSLLCSVHTSFAEEPVTNRHPIAIWEPMGEITTGVGFRNNVLRSSIDIENSTFFLTSGDVSLMRYSETGALLLLYVMGEDIRYSDSPSVNYEQFLSGTADASVPMGDRDEVGLLANYLYQHQVVDASETEVNIHRILVLGHSATLRPYWKHTFDGGWAAKVEGSVLRQIFEHELDSYSEADRMLSLIYGYGHRSEALVSYESTLRYYDTREQYDETGAAIAGTDLIYSQNEVSSRWQHCWDADRHWRTTSRLSYLLNHDNGSGYFNYERLLFRQQVRWDNEKWNIKANARFGWYFYPIQKIGNEDRTRSYALLDFRIERKLNEYLMLFTAGEHEWSTSNDPLDEYRSWMVSGGIGVEF
jgi:hypothetical protein